MSRMKQEREDDAPRATEGNTVTAQGEAPEPKPRLPHEHDESADSQATDNPAARRVGQIAHDGVERGQQDTSRAQETDAAYQKLRQDETPARRDTPKAGGSGR